MKVLYFTHFLSPKGGGGEVIFYELAKGMAMRGHEVHVICHKIDSQELENLEGVTIHRIEPTIQESEYFLSVSQHFLFTVHALIRGYRLLRNGHFDIIHVNTITPIIAGSILATLFRIPIIRTVHDVYTTVSADYWKSWGSQKSVPRFSTIIAPYYERLSLRLPVTVTHAVSETTYSDLLSIKCRGKIVIIPNGLSLERSSYAASNQDYCKYVVFIGRLVSYKNVGVVISAFDLVVKAIPGARFIIVGDGPMREDWERSVKGRGLEENIQFVGFVTTAKKNELLRNCSGFVFPSLVEGLPLVILEAFAMCKPVIASDVKPMNAIVDDEINGFLVQPFDEKAWTEKILYLLSNVEICQRMGLAGRKKLEERYDFCLVLEKMEHLYTDLSARGVQ